MKKKGFTCCSGMTYEYVMIVSTAVESPVMEDSSSDKKTDKTADTCRCE